MVETREDVPQCRRCHRVTPTGELDRLLWCEDCLAAERKRAFWWGQGLAVVAAGLLGVWIALSIRPGEEFLVLWGLVVIVAYGLGSRLGHELVYGIIRVRNREGARARGASVGAGEGAEDGPDVPGGEPPSA